MTQSIDLESALQQRFDWSFKGLPEAGLAGLLDEGELLGTPLLEAGFWLPVMILKESALDHNIRLMADWCQQHGVLLAPHAKTAMAPQLVARQLAAGAWGITVATMSQARTFRRFGVERILLANELVDRRATEWVLSELSDDPGFEFLCYVDSIEGVQLLADNCAGHHRQMELSVLIEMGTLGGRAGCRTLEGVLDVARAVAAAGHLRLRGLAGYEGTVPGAMKPGGQEAVRRYCQRIAEATEALVAAGLLGEPHQGSIVSAGGSSYFDVVADLLSPAWAQSLGVSVMLRSGAYVAHDVGLYAGLSPLGTRPPGSAKFEPALELWAEVLSRPEEGLAIIGAGSRDVSWSDGYPVLRQVWPSDAMGPGPLGGWTVTRLNDQHAYAHAEAAVAPTPLQVGDRVGLGISHPCIAFDRWQLIPLVDDEYRLLGCVRTFF